MPRHLLNRKSILLPTENDPDWVAFYAKCPRCDHYAAIQKSQITFSKSYVYFCFNHESIMRYTSGKRCSYHEVVVFELTPDDIKNDITSSWKRRA